MMEKPKYDSCEFCVFERTHEDIELLANDILDRYRIFCNRKVLVPVQADLLIWDFLYSQEKLSLDIEADLPISNGYTVLGCTSLTSNGGLIEIDRMVPNSPRYPFTLAHEIGHWVLHRNILLYKFQLSQELGDGNKKLLSLVSNVDIEDFDTQPLEERQANYFAACLLMPAKDVAEAFTFRYGKSSRRYGDAVATARSFKNRRDYSRFMAKSGQSGAISALTDMFSVSVESMAIRLEQLALV